MTQDNTKINRIEPVATKLETMQFNCFHVSSANAEKLRQLTVGAKLYTSPPGAAAIIAQQAEVIALSEDSRLMDEYLKLQRDHERQAETIEKLRADNDRLSGACRDKDAAAEAGKEKS